MRLLVTRPAHKARALEVSLVAMGHQVVIEPLLDICLVPLPVLRPEEFGGLLFTSANGVEALVAAGGAADFTHLPVYCVGAATARAARTAGFANVTSADGDGQALGRLIAARLAPCRLLHVKGRHGLAEPEATLTAAGFNCVTMTGYEARAHTALTAPVAAALEAREFDAVLLYSPRSAQILVGLLEKIGITAPFAMAFCLSPAISAAAAPLAGQCEIATTPDEPALLASIAAWSNAGRG